VSTPYLPHSLKGFHENELKGSMRQQAVSMIQPSLLKGKVTFDGQMCFSLGFCRGFSTTFFKHFMKIASTVNLTDTMCEGMSKPFSLQVTLKSQMFSLGFIKLPFYHIL